MHGAYPILSCEEAGRFEAEYFGGDETREWAAMQAAGRAVANGILDDFREIGPWPRAARVLVLAGKGHNAGDALIAAEAICRQHPDTRVDVALAFGQAALRPLARLAWMSLEACGCVRVLRGEGEWTDRYDVVLDGVFGFQFRPSLPPEAARVIDRANATDATLRAAVDLPSGLREPGAFLADFTYATGIVKSPLLTLPNAGRVRFLDLGFPLAKTPSPMRGIGVGVLDGLRALRPSCSDKRGFGHVLIVAGSRRYPGAALMAVLAALRAGAGLVTAAVPESLVPAFAAQVPEAMWIGMPETPDGGLALEGLHLVREAFGRATAVVLGPGLGREAETLALAKEIVVLSPHPLVIDADAIRPEIVAAGGVARVLTPHAGEFARIEMAIPRGAVVVKKGTVTRVARAGEGGAADGEVYHSFFGGPVLARGGSGDLLAGIAGTLLACEPGDPLGAAARAVAWHGLAADALARAHGAQAVRTTQLLDFLGAALRDSRV